MRAKREIAAAKAFFRMADDLNAEDWATPEKHVFDAPMVRGPLQRRGLGTKRPIWSGNVHIPIQTM
jgi:hypothetical protein